AACARLPHDARDIPGLVAHDPRLNHAVAGGGEQLPDYRAAGVRFGGLRVGDGQDETADCLGRRRLVLTRRGVRRAHAYDRSRISTRWSTSIVEPACRNPCWICKMHPGLAVTSAVAPVASTWLTFRRRSRPATSGPVRL